MSESECEYDSEASLGDTIEAVEDCISKLSSVEREKYVVFCKPKEGEMERAALWTKYNIQEQVCTEDLGELLHRLAEAQRDRPWFTWLQWTLFGI